MSKTGIILFFTLLFSLIVSLSYSPKEVSAEERETPATSEELEINDASYEVNYLPPEKGRVAKIKVLKGELKSQPLSYAEVEVRRDGRFVRLPTFFPKKAPLIKNQYVLVHQYVLSRKGHGSKTNTVVEPLPTGIEDAALLGTEPAIVEGFEARGLSNYEPFPVVSVRTLERGKIQNRVAYLTPDSAHFDEGDAVTLYVVDQVTDGITNHVRFVSSISPTKRN